MSNVTRREALALAGMGALTMTGCALAPEDEPKTIKDVQPLSAVELDGFDDPTYYRAPYETLEEAVEESREVAWQIEGEGIVLLKNDGILPLSPGQKVTLLGRGAADPVFGGTGAAGFSGEKCTSLREGLQAAGLEVNATAYDWLSAHAQDRPRAAVGHLDWPETVSHYIGELPWDLYPQDVRESLSGSLPIVVISRQQHEGADLSTNLLEDLNSGVSDTFLPNEETANYAEGQHELELTVEERGVIAAAKAACGQVVVLLNVATTMEVGDLVQKGADLEAAALLQIGYPGEQGAFAVGAVLTGTVNPSGRTCDLWAADLTKTPSFANFGNHTYTDVEDYYHDIGSQAHFVEYAEGIYVGYRYFETAHDMGAIDYDAEVTFPFGYGLSYTTFDQHFSAKTYFADGSVELDVEVQNTGDRAGKDVVQLYCTAPWQEGDVEKSAVQLVAFGKTRELAPGERDVVSLTIDPRDLASYDVFEAAWVLDEGEYGLTLRSDSHTVVAQESILLDGATYTTDSATGAKIKNRFQDVTDYMDDYVTQLTRADMAGTLPQMAHDKTAASVGLKLAEFDPLSVVNDKDEMPELHAKNGISLIDLRGKPMDDPLWDKLLDQLLVVHMTDCLANSVSGTPEVTAVGKPQVRESDGPSGFTADDHCAFPSEYVLAQTWNVDLAYALGEAIGSEALLGGLNGWAAPATNMHRSPFGGRNFEYYSEDPLLAGSMATQTVSAVASHGVYAELKHFLLNDQDTNRCAHILTWASEQAIREIYARPFEMVVKNARTTRSWINADTGKAVVEEVPACISIMSSYNYIGDVWAGGRESLVTGLLRDEWGFTGHVISDWSFYDYMEKNQAIYAGTDVNFTSEVMTGDIVDDQSATAVLAMRRAMHRYLYTLANTNAVNGQLPTVKVSYT